MIRAFSRRRQAGFFAISLGLLTSASALAGPELKQADGSLITLEQPAQRIITLSPHLAELAYAAGAGERLLATAEYSDFPHEAGNLPRIGDAFRFDLERIMALEPDLVIGWASGNPEAALSRLESLGIRVWRTEIQRPEDIANLLNQIAAAAGLPSPPAAMEARKKLEQLKAAYAGKKTISYFYQVAQKPLFTLNGQHLVSQGLAICGAHNVFAAEGVLAPQVSREAVLLADPDVLIAPVLPDQADPLAHWLAWPRLSAVRNQAFILLPANEISRATGRTLDSFLVACRQLDTLRRTFLEDSDS